MCRERDSNPHSHYWPRDFKSLVSTIPPFERISMYCRPFRYGLAKVGILFHSAKHPLTKNNDACDERFRNRK